MTAFEAASKTVAILNASSVIYSVKINIFCCMTLIVSPKNKNKRKSFEKDADKLNADVQHQIARMIGLISNAKIIRYSAMQKAVSSEIGV